MGLDLNLTNMAIDDPKYQDFYKDLQGNLLKSHGRDHSLHIFLRFHDAKASRLWLSTLADSVTSLAEQYEQSRRHKESGHCSLFTSVMLTAAGYLALGVDENQWPTDGAWRAGMKDLNYKSNPLKDRVEEWEEPFQEEIHALILLAYAGRDLSDEEAQKHLHEQLALMEKSLEGIAEVLVVQQGHVMRNPSGQVMEHFGFIDGISNPLFMKDELKDAFDRDGYEHFDPSAPLNTILVKDPGGAEHGYGSYLVYRKLQQNVKGFWEQSRKLAAHLSNGDGSSVSPEHAAALCVGRFKDGTPLSEDGAQGSLNNFNYDNDSEGLRCPFHAHIRKTNPRNDTMRKYGLPPTMERSRRIVRRGISYGPTDLNPEEEWVDAGLLFLCLQSDIEEQFVFMQNTWCDNTHFVEDETGVDPIVGRAATGTCPVSQLWPARPGAQEDKKRFYFSDVVRTKGGEYFFVPSISFLKQLPSHRF